MRTKTSMARRYNRPLPLGVDVATGETVNLGLDRLSEHLVCLGPTGCGKTQSIMLPLFERLGPLAISVIAMTCKGDYADMCTDSAIAHGLGDKLVRFKPGHAPFVGFNPLKKNGWPAERHAKMARTAVLASRGEHSLDQMPQLSRLLFLALAISLEQGLTLVEAARLLRPGSSPLRNMMLRNVQSEFLRDALAWFHDLKDSRQDELAASSLARLEAFTADPLIRSILTETECCLDLHDLLTNHRKLVVDCNFYSPLVPDDARTMLRLILNSTLAIKFATPKEERSLTVFLLDEAPQYCTMDLAAALELGRELKIAVVLAHQFPSQFKLSPEDARIFDAVQHCARTKIVFGGMHVAELEGVVKDMMIGEFDPYSVKDQVKTLIVEPTETTREVATNGFTIGCSLGKTSSTSSAIARGEARGTSRQWGGSHAHSDAVSLAHSTGVSAGMGEAQTMLPNGEIITMASATNGTTDISTAGTASVESYGEFQSEGENESRSITKTEGNQDGCIMGLNAGYTRSVSSIPFHELTKHWQVDKTFWQLDEFLTVCLQKFKAQPRGHFVIKVPDHKAVFVRANYVRVPWVSNAMRERALARMHERLLAAGSPTAIAPPANPAYQLSSGEVKSAGEPQPPPENDPMDDFLR